MADLKSIGDSISAQFRGLNGLHPGQWPLVPRALCAMATLTAVVALGWYAYWDSQFEELNRGQQEEMKLKEDYKTKVQQAMSLVGLRKQKDVSDLNSVLGFSTAPAMPNCRNARWKTDFCATHRMDSPGAVSPLRSTL